MEEEEEEEDHARVRVACSRCVQQSVHSKRAILLFVVVAVANYTTNI